MAITDPRSHGRYRKLRREWLASLPRPVVCNLCGGVIDMDAPATQDLGPTVEHLTPIRVILAQAPTLATALAWCCDTSQWAPAHRLCQNRQGGQVVAGRVPVAHSRVW